MDKVYRGVWIIKNMLDLQGNSKPIEEQKGWIGSKVIIEQAVIGGTFLLIFIEPDNVELPRNYKAIGVWRGLRTISIVYEKPMLTVTTEDTAYRFTEFKPKNSQIDNNPRKDLQNNN